MASEKYRLSGKNKTSVQINVRNLTHLLKERLDFQYSKNNSLQNQTKAVKQAY
jgi:hypothetical protein